MNLIDNRLISETEREHLALSLRTYHKFIEQYQGNSIDFCIDDVTIPPPYDMALAIQGNKELFKGIEKRLINAPLYSSAKKVKQDVSNPLVLASQYPHDYTLLYGWAQELRKEGYKDLWFLSGGGRPNDILTIYAFIKLRQKDFEDQVPFIQVREKVPYDEWVDKGFALFVPSIVSLRPKSEVVF